MLQAIRERVTGIVAIFVLGLLAVPFLFFGVESYIRDVPQDSIARVGDIEITVSEFQTEFARHRAQLRAEQGDAYDDIAVNRPEYRREFLEDMINQRLLLQHAADLGLEISPGALFEVIRSIPAFQLEGQFSPEFYQQRLRAAGQNPAQFERELARDLMVRQVPLAVSASALVTEADVDRWLRINNETRRVSLLPVDSRPFRDPDAITEDEILAFYEENASQFMAPERITLEYVEIDARDMLGEVEVTEEELRQRYEAVQDRYMSPERRRASHILIEGHDEDQRERASELYQRLSEGADFAELAAEHSDDPGSAAAGGDLGWIEPGVMMEEFEDALYALQSPGDVSEPVRTSFGWHLIRLEEIEPPRGQTFEEARADILEEVRAERAEDLYYELSERLIDAIYAEPDRLDLVAEDLGLELKTIGPFSRFDAEGIAAHPRVQHEAFSDLVLLDRQISEPIELERTHAVAVRVIEHQPARPRDLENVVDEIRERLAGERAREAAREWAEALMAEAGAHGENLEEIAEREEIQLDQRTVTRRDFQLGGQLLGGIFELPAPGEEPELHLLPRGGGWSVVRLEEVTPGDPAAATDAQRNAARQQLRFAQANEEVQGLIEWLRVNTDVRVVEERLN